MVDKTEGGRVECASGRRVRSGQREDGEMFDGGDLKVMVVVQMEVWMVERKKRMEG